MFDRHWIGARLASMWTFDARGTEYKGFSTSLCELSNPSKQTSHSGMKRIGSVSSIQVRVHT